MSVKNIRRASAVSAALVALFIIWFAVHTVRPAGFVLPPWVAPAQVEPATPAQSDATVKLERYIDAVGATLDARPRGALSKIEGTGRRLLAVRGYLRGEGLMASRWSWTAEEIRRYEGSAEHRAALEEVEKVRRKFAEQNPGYEIYVNTQVRNLERQIQLWNETRSVQTAADELVALVLRELSGSAYGDSPNASSANKFRQFLKASQPSTVPTVATPGLSAHGQLRAFDFQVQRGGQLIAGTDSASIGPVWEAQGWEKRLKEAVAAASDKFKGPLQSPREPWHYNYVP